MQESNARSQIDENNKSNFLRLIKGRAFKFIFQSLVILMRILVGAGWLLAGITKITSGGWFSEPGVFLTDYLLTASDKVNVPNFYKFFMEDFVLDHLMFFNYTIPIVQIVAGLFLIIGFMTIPTILVCLFMHINFILSGNMNLMSLTLYTSAFGILLSKKWVFFFSLERYLKSRTLRGFPDESSSFNNSLLKSSSMMTEEINL
jgi:thiosulfate dehydrogenase (quinone) large subunit